MLPLAEWQNLLEVQASAAATLTGLVFVAASINLSRIIAVPSLPARAAETILQFLQVFFLRSAGLIPRQPLFALAIEILAVSLASWLLQLRWHIRYARSRSGHPRRWLVTRILQTQLASIPFFLAAISLFLGTAGALYWLVLGFAFSFFSGVLNSWVLLIEIIR
jgi:hypothetical protein